MRWRSFVACALSVGRFAAIRVATPHTPPGLALAQRVAPHADLADMSWDRTWSGMWSLVERAIRTRTARSRPSVRFPQSTLTQPAMLRIGE